MERICLRVCGRDHLCISKESPLYEFPIRMDGMERLNVGETNCHDSIVKDEALYLANCHKRAIHPQRHTIQNALGTTAPVESGDLTALRRVLKLREGFFDFEHRIRKGGRFIGGSVLHRMLIVN